MYSSSESKSDVAMFRVRIVHNFDAQMCDFRRTAVRFLTLESSSDARRHLSTLGSFTSEALWSHGARRFFFWIIGFIYTRQYIFTSTNQNSNRTVSTPGACYVFDYVFKMHPKWHVINFNSANWKNRNIVSELKNSNLKSQFILNHFTKFSLRKAH